MKDDAPPDEHHQLVHVVMPFRSDTVKSFNIYSCREREREGKYATTSST